MNPSATPENYTTLTDVTSGDPPDGNGWLPVIEVPSLVSDWPRAPRVSSDLIRADHDNGANARGS
jgi:hypothetical protein